MYLILSSHLDGHACAVEALGEQDLLANQPVVGRGKLQLQACSRNTYGQIHGSIQEHGDATTV